MTKRKKPVGWRGNPCGHSMASRGIRSTHPLYRLGDKDKRDSKLVRRVEELSPEGLDILRSIHGLGFRGEVSYNEDDGEYTVGLVGKTKDHILNFKLSDVVDTEKTHKGLTLKLSSREDKYILLRPNGVIGFSIDEGTDISTKFGSPKKPRKFGDWEVTGDGIGTEIGMDIKEILKRS